jgi:hypothetical protein
MSALRPPTIKPVATLTVAAVLPTLTHATLYITNRTLCSREFPEKNTLRNVLWDAYRVMMESPGEGPLGRPKTWWKDNIKMDLGEMGSVVWSGFIWRRTRPVADFIEDVDERSGFIKR